MSIPDLYCDKSLAVIPHVVAGLQLLESWNVPDSGEDDHWEDVDGAGEAAEPVSGKQGVW